jgi:AcrR family transcriptional regulator
MSSGCDAKVIGSAVISRGWFVMIHSSILTKAPKALFYKTDVLQIRCRYGAVKGFCKMTVVQNEKPAKRGRGRPPVRSDDETRHLLIEAAAKEFQLRGFAAAGMGAIAERAGFSTRTIYQLVATKVELFEMVVLDRISRFMLAVDEGTLDGMEPELGLRRILTAYGCLTLSPETIAINRLVIAEGERFPEIAASFHETAVMLTSRVIESWLEHQSERGRIKLSDIHQAAGMLRGMMIMEPQRAVFLGRQQAPSAAEIQDRAAVCAKLFLRGCQV